MKNKEPRGDMEKLKQSSQLKNSGLIFDDQPKKKLRVIGVPNIMQIKEVLTCLYHQNLTDKLQDCSLKIRL